MSIEINWDTLAGGPDGEALAETIRDFVHDKFQTATLPRFLRSINVLSFAFGSTGPQIDIKDICDPLADFYEEQEGDAGDDQPEDKAWEPERHLPDAQSTRARRRTDRAARTTNGTTHGAPTPSHLDIGSPVLGASTPGIPGGTSNLNYFHPSLAAGLSGTQTPLAAVAGAHLPNGWPDYTSASRQSRAADAAPARQHVASVGSQTPPLSTIESARLPSSLAVTGSPQLDASPHTTQRLSNTLRDEESTTPPPRFREPRVEDFQVVLRVRYSGDIKLCITTEILLDYPMPSFVGIPVRLNITGLSFDGVAVVAYIRKRAHFCFLSPEDAYALLGPEEIGHANAQGDNLRGQNPSRTKIGGLLQEIKVESEIGKGENGKQVLKNVGKVEKFVLEQVRKIFEEELVYPSYFTFLV